MKMLNGSGLKIGANTFIYATQLYILYCYAYPNRWAFFIILAKKNMPNFIVNLESGAEFIVIGEVLNCDPNSGQIYIHSSPDICMQNLVAILPKTASVRVYNEDNS